MNSRPRRRVGRGRIAANAAVALLAAAAALVAAVLCLMALGFGF